MSWTNGKRKPASRGGIRGETFVRFTGVALAVGSTAFAARMITDKDYHPEFAGIEHLSIFSKPTRSHTAQLDPDFSRRGAGVDYTPIGVVNSASQGRSKTGFALLEASAGAALLRAPSGDKLRVSRGATVEGLGRVTAIERRGERWVVVTSSGAIVE